MDEEAKQFLKDCIKLYSPSGEKAEFSEFIADFLKKSNFQVKFDEIGNLIAEKGSGKPLLLLISHLDTIPGQFPIEEKEGKIYGRGVVNCKPSLAAMVYALSKYNFRENIGKIVFAGIVQEENSLDGISKFIQSDIQPDFAIIGEPTKINQICIGYKGRLCIGYRVLSQTGHVASSWQYVNAIDVCLEIWKMVKGVCWQLTEIHCPKAQKTKYFNRIIPNLTIISGGHLTNCVPSECEMHIDIRFPPIIESEIVLEEISNSVLNFKEVYQKQWDMQFKVQMLVSSCIEGFDSGSDELIVSALRESIFEILNEKPVIIKKTGTTLINAIAIHYGIPSITYGPGDPKLEHTNDEYIEIEEYLKSIDIYLKFFDKFAEMYQKKQAN